MKAMKSMVTAAVIGMAGSGAAIAAGPAGVGSVDSLPALQVLVNLNIQPAQKKQIATILKTYTPAMRQATDAVIAARKGLFDAVHADTFNEAAVRLASKSVASSEENLSVLQARMVQDLRGVLTQQQIAVLKEHRDTLRSRFDNAVATARQLFDRWLTANSAG